MVLRSRTGQFLPSTTVSSGRPVLVAVPRGGGGRRVARKVGSIAGKAAARVAWDEKHTLAALAASAVFAYARRTNTKLPTVGDLSPVLLYGLGAWALGKWGKSKTASHVATGILSVGLFEQIAYDKETRDAIHQLVVAQAERLRTASPDDTHSEGVVGDIAG